MMSSIRLDELFSCTDRGEILVAEATDGTLVHIADVPSGLACNCICPGCGRRMVAKKGEIQGHHFAHYVRRDGQTCVSAGETALHKFAKRVLDGRLEIALPAMVVEDHGDREVVVEAERRTFDHAILEKKDGQIVPDVVLLLRDRRLIVEFKVTHPCDEQKIARIRAMDIGAIEIDLSQYRDHVLSEIGDQILYDAPRKWLHNPRELKAREKLEDRAKRRDEEKRRLVERFRNAYRHRSPSRVAGNGTCETAAQREGLADLINLPVDGAGCFTVPVAEWQSAVLLTLIGDRKGPFRTRNGLAALNKRGWIDRTFADIADEIASEVSETGIPFKPPIGAVEAYLRQLEASGFIRSGHTETWHVLGVLRGMVEDARKLRDRPVKRKAEIQRRVGEMLAGLPAEETTSFVFEQWWAAELPGRGYSPRDAATFDEAKWQSFEHALMNIATQIRFSPRHKLDLMGFPYEGELSRALERKRLEEEERQRAREAKLEADKAARLDDLRDRAVRQIGEQAQSWLTTANAGTSGQPPLDAATSESGYHDAIGALANKVRENEKLQRVRERKEKAVAELSTVAHSRYVDPMRADLWMRGKRHELGGKSPEEFVIDDITRQRCMELLPSKRSKY